jgi:para-nitrobenzyl esterase
MHFGMKIMCAIAITAMTIGSTMPVHADSLAVETVQGKVQGKKINHGKVKAFLGLPYAAPPVGNLRWRAPEPAAKWDGMRDATRYGAHCFQGFPFDDMVFQDSGPSEDCLFLNVYMPAKAKSNSKLPVMFWIHGGGYSGGSASEPRHNGDFLPTKGVVLVTINYRLGVFGFLATSDLAKEADGAAGNYGMLDMVAALQWVKANIAHFGGDPGNVTIFGESAGSFAVSTLMASAPAQGLFHKVIGESGGALSDALSSGSLDSYEERIATWAAAINAPTIAELRAMPAEAVLEASRKKGAPRFSPVVDGRFLTASVSDIYAQGKQAHVPLLAGWNLDESPSLAQGMTVEKWKAFAAAHFADRAPELLRLYPGGTDEQAARSAADYGGDSFIAFGTWKWIEAHRATGDSPIYRYHFELAAPPSKFHPAANAFHSDDIEYVFGTLDTRPGAVWRAEDRKLSDTMMSYWANFARTGDPNGPGLPAWPKYANDRSLIHLDTPISSGPSTVEQRYEFLMKGMPAAQR